MGVHCVVLKINLVFQSWVDLIFIAQIEMMNMYHYFSHSSKQHSKLQIWLKSSKSRGIKLWRMWKLDGCPCWNHSNFFFDKYHPLLMVMQVYSNLIQVAKVEFISPFVNIWVVEGLIDELDVQFLEQLIFDTMGLFIQIDEISLKIGYHQEILLHNMSM